MRRKLQKNEVFLFFNILFIMNNKDYDKIKSIHIEDFICFVYFFIIALNLYSNILEEKYVKYKNKKDRNDFRKINEISFIILFIIYVYFLYIAFKQVKGINSKTTSRQKNAIYITAFINILFVIAGALSIYIAFENEAIDSDIPLI